MGAKRGFINEAAQVTDIGTSMAVGKVITLNATTTGTGDAKAELLPERAQWSHLEVLLDGTNGSPTTVQASLWWDAACNNLAAGPSAATTLQAGLTNLSLLGCSIKIDTSHTFPTSSTRGTLYCTLNVDAGEVKTEAVKLHWVIDPKS